MRRRPLRLALVVVLALAGLGSLVRENTLERQIAADRAAQRELSPQVAKTRALLIAERKRVAVLKSDLAQLRSRQQTLVARRERAERFAYRSAYAEARYPSYREAYLREFPIEVDAGEEWFIVDATDADAPVIWTADAEHEFQIRDGEPYQYALGEAPADWQLTGDGDVNADGSRGYVNVDGEWVPSPSSNPNLEPSGPGPSAICADGTYSYSRNASGTCSWHGGVAEWLP
jgi:Protein of unknown function (DUF3761)